MLSQCVKNHGVILKSLYVHTHTYLHTLNYYLFCIHTLMGFNSRARTPLSSVVLLFLVQTLYISMRQICNESSTEEMP